MRIVTASLESIAPYAQAKAVTTPRLKKESAQAYEERTWREKCHHDDQGLVVIPAQAFKNCLVEMASFLGAPREPWVPPQQRGHLERGVIVMDPLPLGLHKNDITGLWLSCPANGRK